MRGRDQALARLQFRFVLWNQERHVKGAKRASGRAAAAARPSSRMGERGADMDAEDAGEGEPGLGVGKRGVGARRMTWKPAGVSGGNGGRSGRTYRERSNGLGGLLCRTISSNDSGTQRAGLGP